jgi:hypothetical protein
LPTIIGYYFSIFEIGTFPSQREALNTPPPPLNELCPALVFLHTFFGLAQFCKKLCNPVFNVLSVLQKSEDRSADLQCQCFGHMFCIAGAAGTGPTTTPAGDVALTIGTPSNTLMKEFCFFGSLETQSQKGQIF